MIFFDGIITDSCSRNGEDEILLIQEMNDIMSLNNMNIGDRDCDRDRQRGGQRSQNQNRNQ